MVIYFYFHIQKSMSERDKDFEISHDLLIQGLRLWYPERYANKTDEEILEEYGILCALTVSDMKARGDERMTMIENTLRPIKDAMNNMKE